MEIVVDSLEPSGTSIDHVFASDEIDLNEEFARLLSPPELHGRATIEQSGIRIVGEISVKTEVDCDRCLKNIELPLRSSFDVIYVRGSLAGGEAHQLAEEELGFSFFEGESIDVNELVREQVLLSLPSHVICTETCKGLCPRCGANLNDLAGCGCEAREIDPRWAALKNLN